MGREAQRDLRWARKSRPTASWPISAKAIESKSIDKAYVLRWLEGICEEMKRAAEAEGLQLRDLACTLLGAIVRDESALFFQIGDGAVIYAKEGEEEYREVFWPQHGEFANQTNFIFQETQGMFWNMLKSKGASLKSLCLQMEWNA